MNSEKENIEKMMKTIRRTIFSFCFAIFFIYFLDSYEFFAGNVFQDGESVRSIVATFVGLGLGWRISR